MREDGTEEHRIDLSLLQQPEFLQDHVAPVLAHRARAIAPGGWQVRVVRFLGAERATVEYRHDEGERLFAKVYADGAEGLAAYENLHALWKHGFGPRSLYRVPEPLAYLPQYNVLLMRAAPGNCVQSLATCGWETWQHGLRTAAHWLAALHTSPLRHGPPEDERQSVLRLAQRVAKAAARHPEAETMLIHLLEELAARSTASKVVHPYVQTHGRYHAEHVFLAPECVTVIDLDRSCPGDPAKDVAEFLHRLRAAVGKSRVEDDAAERATGLFLNEYRCHSPVDISRLVYYWSYSILRTLLHTMRKRHLDQDTWKQRLEFYQAEFYAVPGRLG